MDGVVALVHRVRVELVEGEDGARLVARGMDGVARVELSLTSLVVDGEHEGGVVYVRGPEGVQLSSDDLGLAEALRARGVRATTRPDRGRPFWAGLAFACGIVALVWAWYTGTPWVARVVAHNLPLSVERDMGRSLLLVLDLVRIEDAAANAVLIELAERLDPSGEVPHDVGLLEDSTPNAFALPGGTIVLSCGLVEEASGGAEIAGVLAHELEHVARRHLLTRMIRDGILSGIWALAVGDYAGLMVIDPTTAADIYQLRFGREEEHEADLGAVRRLRDAGIEPSGLARFFERLGEELEAGPSWLSTHPTSAERIAAIYAAIAAAPPTSESLGGQPAPLALSEADLETLLAACR